MKYKLIAVVCIILGVGFSSAVLAQRTSAKTYINLINEQKAQLDSMENVLIAKDSAIKATSVMLDKEKLMVAGLRDEIMRLDAEKNDLSEQLDGFHSDNLHLNQSNRILIVFNFLVGVLLMITLVFFLRRLSRRRSADENADEEDTSIPETAAPENRKPASVHLSFEDKLMQLERLGSLREKGMLTDEEFNSQKRNLLG